MDFEDILAIAFFLFLAYTSRSDDKKNSKNTRMMPGVPGIMRVGKGKGSYSETSPMEEVSLDDGTSIFHRIQEMMENAERSPNPEPMETFEEPQKTASAPPPAVTPTATPAVTTPGRQKAPRRSFFLNLNPATMGEAVVLSEIIMPPKSKRRR